MSNRRYQMRKARKFAREWRKPGRFIGISHGDGLVSRAAVRSAQPLDSDVRRSFVGVSRGHGAAHVAQMPISSSVLRRPFTGISRGDGIVSRAAVRSAQRGFSLMEIIIVTILIGAIVAFAARQVLGGGDRANYRIAEAQIQTLAQKIDQYEMDTGRLPGALQDLVTQPGDAPGWLGPYARNDDLVDPWKTPIQYRVPGDGRRFDLISLGADRAPGGESVNADIRYQ